MNTRTLLILTALAALAAPILRAQAPPSDPLGPKLFPPDFILANADALKLTDEQRNALRDTIQAAQARFNEMQEPFKGEMDALARILDQPDPDQAAVLAQFDKVQDREREIKRAQLSLMLALRKTLTDEQRTKLAQIRSEKTPKLPPQDLRDKAERVKAGAAKWQSEGRDVSPIAELMNQVGPLVGAGKMQEAGALLDQALKLIEGGGK